MQEHAMELQYESESTNISKQTGEQMRHIKKIDNATVDPIGDPIGNSAGSTFGDSSGNSLGSGLSTDSNHTAAKVSTTSPSQTQRSVTSSAGLGKVACGPSN